MMRLPTFTKKDPPAESLRSEQLRLQEQADKMLKQTGILDVFSRYGELSSVGGSYEYGLMTYPDLDVSLSTKLASRKHVGHILADLINDEHVRKIASVNLVDFDKNLMGKPKGYWIGVEIPFEGDRWGIDCWVQHPDWVNKQYNQYSTLLKELPQKRKDLILAIKYDLIRTGKYGNKFQSADVYDSVLERDIHSVQDFYRSTEAES